MAISSGGVKLYLELWQRGLFKQIGSVVELGSIDLGLSLNEFEKLVRAAGISAYERERFGDLANWPGRPRCSSRAFYELLGVEKYDCIDLSEEHGAIALDLNLPLDKKSLWGQYDLVTDFGCAEHAFNIAEAYRTMHRLCKPSGFIIAVQNVYGGGNGYYDFDLSFFEGLAAANQYRVLFASYIICPRENAGDYEFHVPLSRELLSAVDWLKVQYIAICYVMQKQKDDDFRFPYQGGYLSGQQRHYGYELQFLPDPPSRSYVPVVNLGHVVSGVRTRALIGLTIRAVLRSVGTRCSRMVRYWLRGSS